ncbi:hypothetical protein ABIE67_005227 [Streptomyces sp. V4I8]
MVSGVFLLVGDLHVEGVAVQDAVEGVHLVEALFALAVVLTVDQPDGEAVVALGGPLLGRGEGVLVALQAAAGVVAPDLLAFLDGLLAIVFDLLRIDDSAQGFLRSRNALTGPGG